MTTFYIASGLENAPRVRELRDHLLAAGWGITYDWTVHGSVRGPDVPRERIVDVADREVDGVLLAQVVIVLLPGGRGTHTELGVALACEIGDGNRVVIWSATPDVDFGTTEATSAFYHHPGVEHRSDPDHGVARAVVGREQPVGGSDVKLWKTDHPYYGPGGHSSEEFASWSDFVVEWGDADPDYNHLYRWDWQEGGDHGLGPGIARLYLCFVQPRKNMLFSVEVAITRGDESVIRAWLAGRWQHLCKIWAPFAPASRPKATTTDE